MQCRSIAGGGSPSRSVVPGPGRKGANVGAGEGEEAAASRPPPKAGPNARCKSPRPLQSEKWGPPPVNPLSAGLPQ